MTRRRIQALLWAGFLVAHAVVIAVAYSGASSDPKGDVSGVYLRWSQAAADPAHQIIGLDAPWVYPILALVPIMLATLFAWAGGYTVGWAVMIVLLDAACFWLLVGRGTSRGRAWAAAFWLAGMIALGPVGLYRLEAVAVPLAILGGLWLMGRPALGATLLSVATWVKVWPAGVLVSALVAGRRRMPVLAAALAVNAVVLGALALVGDIHHAFSFMTTQEGRNLQVEAPVTTPYLWTLLWRDDLAVVFYNRPLSVWEVVGWHSTAVSTATTPLLALVVVAIAGVGVWKARAGASFVRLFPVLALALVTALIVVNKVGSPQYYAWLLAPVAVAVAVDRRRWRWTAGLVIVLCALSQAIYPFYYREVLDADWLGVTLVTVRNAGVIGLLVGLLVRLGRLPTPVKQSPARAGRPAVPHGG